MIPLEEGVLTNPSILVTSFFISTRENPEEKNFILSTELKQYGDGMALVNQSHHFLAIWLQSFPLQKRGRSSYD